MNVQTALENHETSLASSGTWLYLYGERRGARTDFVIVVGYGGHIANGGG